MNMMSVVMSAVGRMMFNTRIIEIVFHESNFVEGMMKTTAFITN